MSIVTSHRKRDASDGKYERKTERGRKVEKRKWEYTAAKKGEVKGETREKMKIK